MIVIIYSTSTCVYCNLAKKFFKENKIKYKEINVENPLNLAKMFAKSKQMGTPVIDVNGKIIVGFDKKALKKALKLNK